jgi:CDP-diacylglycerol--serine O-phosphatidyltransferase
MANIFPPFDPDDNPRFARMRQLRQVPIRMVIPNLITLLALGVGLTSVRMAIEQRFFLAVLCIIAAAILDGIDGRMARYLKSTSRFGAQLDSLTDFVNFGVAPAVVIFTYALRDTRALGWTCCLIFAVCSALRLARFNVALEGPVKPAWQNDFFVGVPAPAAACSVLLPIYLTNLNNSLHLGIPRIDYVSTTLVMIYTIVIAILMISRLPTYSGKSLGARIPRDMVVPILVGIVAFFALLVSFPWEVLTLCTLLYLGALPLGWRAYERLKEAEARPAATEPGPP